MESLPWEAFRDVVDPPHMLSLRIESSGRQGEVYEAAKRILCSVLHRTQLTWALESGKLQFGPSYKPITSA
ncbi:uncharacterized protein PHACADRAFT_262152 [Phanerochaete carnosa HHB-10118-sp]|uniref:Uncharacterized protein n=1 Tax=Phanerochaete carnosa (strain HHB-10118-sp) TaxID=650164 RepID=K5VKC2_PHACS|nr:uncharacterized protein PHACADRAFT_262152 [Phanerochaete carnosa HHB-10118-sp]EKM51808.1 hypothetical protein PHACADRAFT_262152 [Phanerochaete carnosa HHB-10118-sp]